MALLMVRNKRTPFGSFDNGAIVAGLSQAQANLLAEGGDAIPIPDVDGQLVTAAVDGATGLPTGLSTGGAGVGDAGATLVFGDSKGAREWLNSATDVSTVGYGALNHANLITGQCWDVVANLGVSGDTTDQMLARLDTAVAVARRCGWVLFHGGTNDLYGSLKTAAQTIPNLATIADAFLDTGANVVWFNETPRAFVDQNKVSYQLQLNAWGREFQRRRKHFYAFDAADAMSDPASTQFAAAAGLLDGSVHWNNACAYLIGARYAARFGGMAIPQSHLASSAADVYSVSSLSGQLFANPLFTGSGGTPSNTAGGNAPTGTIAASVQVDKSGHGSGSASTCVCSTVARADGFGNNQRLVIANAINGDRYLIRNTGNISAGVSPGHLVQLEGELTVASHTNLGALHIYLQYQVDGGSVITAHCLRNDTANVAYPAAFAGGKYRTRPVRLPAGTALTALQVRAEARFVGAGGATVDLGRAALRNLTALGLDN